MMLSVKLNVPRGELEHVISLSMMEAGRVVASIFINNKYFLIKEIRK